MTVRRRLLLVLIVSALSGAIVVAAAAVSLVRSVVRDRFIDRIRSETALLAEWTGPVTADIAQEFAVRAAGHLGVRVTLIDADGIVLSDSSRDDAGVARMDNHLNRPEVEGARLRGHGESFRISDTTNVEYFYSAELTEGTGPVKYVRIALPASEVYRVQARYALLVAGVVPVAMLLLSGIAYAAVRRLSRPMERMADVVERSARGDLQLDLPRDGGEEVERLGRAVKRMQLALLEKLDELGAERSLLSSVVEGVREGLLLVGSDRRVRLANRQLRQTLDLDFDPQGHPLTDVVRHPTVIDDIETAFERGIEVQESILRLPAGHSFQLRFTPLDHEKDGTVDAVLVLFLDVTQLEKLEGVRREFVANVSHELRTPLTSIKAFVDTLTEGGGLEDSENARKFLGIIRKHADRMGDLIEDLTHLSRIETGAISLELSALDAATVVRSVVENLRPLAEKRRISIRSELPAPFPIRADARRLEQMITNLVDNAVKFSEAGSQVRIAGRTDGGAVISVEDDGIGIATESLDKVFHRFHQEDRDRSPERQGTGLGLSIVKHLMRLHGGRVRVESELGRGSTFFLEFPESA